MGICERPYMTRSKKRYSDRTVEKVNSEGKGGTSPFVTSKGLFERIAQRQRRSWTDVSKLSNETRLDKKKHAIKILVRVLLLYFIYERYKMRNAVDFEEGLRPVGPPTALRPLARMRPIVCANMTPRG